MGLCIARAPRTHMSEERARRLLDRLDARTAGSVEAPLLGGPAHMLPPYFARWSKPGGPRVVPYRAGANAHIVRVETTPPVVVRAQLVEMPENPLDKARVNLRIHAVMTALHNARMLPSVIRQLNAVTSSRWPLDWLTLRAVDDAYPTTGIPHLVIGRPEVSIAVLEEGGYALSDDESLGSLVRSEDSVASTILMVFHTLFTAQRLMEFVHADLHSGNVLMREVPPEYRHPHVLVFGARRFLVDWRLLAAGWPALTDFEFARLRLPPQQAALEWDPEVIERDLERLSDRRPKPLRFHRVPGSSVTWVERIKATYEPPKLERGLLRCVEWGGLDNEDGEMLPAQDLDPMRDARRLLRTLLTLDHLDVYFLLELFRAKSWEEILNHRVFRALELTGPAPADAIVWGEGELPANWPSFYDGRGQPQVEGSAVSPQKVFEPWRVEFE